jgi:hypothetical protein
MHTEVWRQKLAGKGKETGSQTEASKQAGRQAEGSGQLKQAKIDTVRER